MKTNIKEAFDNLDFYTDIQRKQCLPKLIASLSPVSKEKIQLFRSTWDKDRPDMDFIDKQNRLVKKCFKEEITSAIIKEDGEIDL